MPTGDSRVIGRSRMTSRMASTASDGNDRLRKDRSLAIFRAVVAAKYTSSSSSSSSSSAASAAAVAIHNPCEPLMPVVLLHDCRSFTSVQPNCLWEWAPTPVYNIIWPPPCSDIFDNWNRNWKWNLYTCIKLELKLKLKLFPKLKRNRKENMHPKKK